MRTKHVSLFAIVLLMLVIVAAIVSGILNGNGRGTVEAGVLQDDPAVAIEEPLLAEEEVANCRFGVAIDKGSPHYQWVDDLGAGWWIDFEVNYEDWATASNGAEYAHVIWTEQKKAPNGDYLNDYDIIPPLENNTLGYLLDRRPGRMWIVGNEVDRAPDPPPDTGVGQGDTYPQVYAEIYYKVYNYIKAWDPTALVAPSALVQFTPGREQYLDIVWDTYMDRYGEPMPIDFWNMHLYVLPERKPDGRANNIASVALGTQLELGFFEAGGDKDRCSEANVYCIAEHDSMDAFAQQVVRMRTWMKDHGYQNYPLLITEYSLLYRYEQDGGSCTVMDEFGDCFEPPRVEQFANNTFNYLLTEANPDLGYPHDNNKLVQQWMWFGMYRTGDFSASNLAASATGPLVLTKPGQAFYDSARAQPAAVNLLAADTKAQPGTVDAGDISVKLGVVMRNNGNTRVNEPIKVTFYRDAGLTEELGSTTVPAPDVDFMGMTGCATRGLEVTLDASWQEQLGAGTYPFWAKVDSNGAIPETSEDDNVISGSFTLISVQKGNFIPLVVG